MLAQSTFGATTNEIERLSSVGISEWLRDEVAKSHTRILPDILTLAGRDEDDRDDLAEAFWFRAIKGDDALRQRVAFALSQIFVASFADGTLQNRPIEFAYYMDVIGDNAFGNYRQLLEEITYSPAMGIYLTYRGNRKANEDRGTVPDENYAREVMQLFSIGLVQLQRNGEPVLDAQGQPIETYTNEDVSGLARVFTGLDYPGLDRVGRNPDTDQQRASAMVVYPEEHAPEEKAFLGTVIPADTPGEQSIALALDALYTHPNTAPFISKQLIQRLVTSNPSLEYVTRVTEAFELGAVALPDGEFFGSGVRGDLSAVVAAILVDPEARLAESTADPNFGKIREPVLRFVNWARTFEVNNTRLSAAGSLRDTRSTDRLAQQAYRSPSVFNFYRPGFVAPASASADAGLVAPEMQIITASSVTGYANFMEDYITRSSTADSFAPDYSQELSLASDPAALVNHLDLLMTNGSMAPETRARIVDAVAAVDSGHRNFTQEEVRVQTAILFVMTSPDYLVVR